MGAQRHRNLAGLVPGGCRMHRNSDRSSSATAPYYCLPEKKTPIKALAYGRDGALRLDRALAQMVYNA